MPLVIVAAIKVANEPASKLIVLKVKTSNKAQKRQRQRRAKATNGPANEGTNSC